MNKSITDQMKDHYSKTFSQHGCTTQGVDWGTHDDRALLRHKKIAELITKKPCTILDVGCGYGAFLDYLGENNISFTGIDIVDTMIGEAQKRHPHATFINGNFLAHDFGLEEFDYVVCNGILTQKLDASIIEMDRFSKAIIKKMFSIARKGIVFNHMSNHVNFMAPNLFYKSPVETLSWVMNELTPHVRLDHAYPLYEYMVYAYKENGCA